MTQRGDLVTVALPGAYGKPRPALVTQSDLLAELESVLVCPITSDLRDVMFRVTVEPSLTNGLQNDFAGHSGQDSTDTSRESP